MSNEVKRYDPNYAAMSPADDLAVEAEDGMFVMATDYSALEAELAKLRAGQEPVRFWFIGDAGQQKGATYCKKSSRDGSLAFFECEEDAKRAALRHPGTEVYPVEYYRKPQATPQPATVQGGVYSTDPLACSGCVSGCFRCRSVKVQGDGWIPVRERLPESERTVLAFYLNSHGKGRRVRAEYIAAKTKSADDGWDSDEPADYDEQADEYFWPAGWYEVMDNWDDLTHMVIHEGEVTHWMPLPESPAIAAARKGE